MSREHWVLRYRVGLRSARIGFAGMKLTFESPSLRG